MKHRTPGDGWITFAVFGLVVMATWTAVIKYLAPVLYFVSERAAGQMPDSVPVMWDFWWVAHLALAWLLWRRHSWAWAAGMLLSLTEVVIVVVKFARFLARPDWSFWRLLWFTNKAYVLGFFIFLTFLLLTPGFRAAMKMKRSAASGSGGAVESAL